MDLSTLNERQKQAVNADVQALLILAGAGSGKTRVLTSRIAHLIQARGVADWQILAFTFTNKAAAEMKARVAKALNQAVDSLWIGTFHSICSRILRREIGRLGYNQSFTIYDASDQRTLIKQLMKQFSMGDEAMPPAAVLSTISEAKNHGIGPAEMEAKASGDIEKKVAGLYHAYEREKRKNNALDFDDLILKVIELFDAAPEVLEKYQRQFRYIFVDEYQDTNRIQYDLILRVTGTANSICAVGDADQSIYGWRGADITNILNFERDFPEAQTILLEQNYRSTKRILKAANTFIAKNEHRREKHLWTENREGEPIRYRPSNNEFEEAQTVITWINQERYREHAFSDMAILYRTNAQSRAFEEALIREGIPYRIIGGIKFYDRAEIKDLIAYMNLIVNPTDDVAFARIINQPKRGIGAASIQALAERAREYGLSMLDALNEPSIFAALSGAQQAKFKPFLNMINALSAEVTLPIDEFCGRVYRETGYAQMLEASRAVEDQTRIENINAFFGAMAQYREETEGASIVEYLQSLSLMSDLDKTDDKSGGVSLMTIHSAKGLEFPIVFITGLEDGLFPSRRTLEEGQLEEERRLFYVAITRAQQKLYMTSAGTRRVFGAVTSTMPSRFIEELEDTIQSDAPHSSASYGSDDDFDASRHEVSRARAINGGYGFADPALRKAYDAQRERIRRLVQEKKEREDQLASTPFRVGDRVRHRKFGEGMVVSVIYHEDGDEVTVAFDKKGIKRLNASIAPLERL